jgi:hypothetical protein
MNARERATRAKGEATNRTNRLREKNTFELRALKRSSSDRLQFAPELKNKRFYYISPRPVRSENHVDRRRNKNGLAQVSSVQMSDRHASSAESDGISSKNNSERNGT